jgi:hypothetical protein
MQKPFAYFPINNIADNSSFRRQLSIVAFAGAIVVLVAIFALVKMQSDTSYSAARGTITSSNEFSSGMPLP